VRGVAAELAAGELVTLCCLLEIRVGLKPDLQRSNQRYFDFFFVVVDFFFGAAFL
jgi:hypothetical protein